MKTYDCLILENRSIAKDTYKMKLSSYEFETEDFTPGTFINLKVGNEGYPLLRRPISIFHTDHENSSISIIYKDLGMGTNILSQRVPGEKINVQGPLGTGFPLMETGESVLLVGGGVGIPPLHELGVRLKEKGIHIVTVLGFRDSDSVFCVEDFQKFGEVHAATEDGTYGMKGYVTDVIEKKGISFDVIYACGPKAMLKSMDLRYQGEKIGYISVEERMACGIGACYGCMADTKEGLKRVCKDGPVFRLGEIVYE